MTTTGESTIYSVLHIGAADGPDVVFLHSAPGAGGFDPDPEATQRAGVRLITVDRPGYGTAPVMPGVPTVARTTDDIAAGLRAAGVKHAAVAGWSAGGRYALGLAVRHPELVRRVALFGTPAPHDQVPWVPEAFEPMNQAMRANPTGAVELLTAAFAEMGMTTAESGLESLAVGPADAAIVERAGVRARLEVMMRGAYAQGSAGVVRDIVSDQAVPWGFDPATAEVPVRCYYGSGDLIVGTNHGEYWARTVRDGSFRAVAEAGHLVPIVAWEEALGWLLAS